MARVSRYRDYTGCGKRIVGLRKPGDTDELGCAEIFNEMRFQRRLAEVLGVSRSTVSRKLCGRSRISVLELGKIAESHQICLLRFFDEDLYGLLAAARNVRGRVPAAFDTLKRLVSMKPDMLRELQDVVKSILPESREVGLARRLGLTGWMDGGRG